MESFDISNRIAVYYKVSGLTGAEIITYYYPSESNRVMMRIIKSKLNYTFCKFHAKGDSQFSINKNRKIDRLFRRLKKRAGAIKTTQTLQYIKYIK